MVYDITDKLHFEKDPVLKIKNVELTIKSDAEDVLKIMDVLRNEGEYEALEQCMAILLDEEDQEKLAGLKLKMPDYNAVMQAAVSLALGEDPDAEEKNG